MQSETNEPNIDFKSCVAEWLDLNTYITETQTKLREKKKRMNTLSEYIKGYMQINHKEICNIGDSGESLVIKTKKSHSTINKEYIKKILENELSEEQATNLTKSIYENRTLKETSVLKRMII